METRLAKSKPAANAGKVAPEQVGRSRGPVSIYTKRKAAPSRRKLVVELRAIEQRVGLFVDLLRPNMASPKIPLGADEIKTLNTIVETLGILREQYAGGAQLSSRQRAPQAKPVAVTATRESEIPRLISEGQLLTSAEFVARIGISLQAVRKAVEVNRMFSVEYAGANYYPAFYVGQSLDRKKVEKVSKLLGDLPSSAKLQFFLNGRGSLGGLTPIEALQKKDKTNDVLIAAQGFAE